jgi:hypothetical protein
MEDVKTVLPIAIVAVLVTGCGGTTGDKSGRAALNPDSVTPSPSATQAPVDVLTGAQVGSIAEEQLEAQNPTMAPGTMSCPDLDFAVGASVRCLRTTRLSRGRVVKVEGTVEVTSLTGGGKLHVQMDERAMEFGLAGGYLATEVSRVFTRTHHRTPSRVRCPYLRGAVGNTIACRLVDGDQRHDLDIVVTAVDPAAYDTDYAFR